MTNNEVIQQSKTKNKKKLQKIVIFVLALTIAAAVGVYFLINYINNKPTTYVDENGNKVSHLSRNQMAEAYELGVSYFEQGDYENAIVELAKVTDKSPMYEDAQRVREEAMAAYANKLIEQSEAQLENGNYEAALSIVEGGKALLGDDAELYGQVQSVLNTLKADMISRMEEAQKQEDYTQAFHYIQIAKEFLPEDAEVQTNYDRLHAMSIAQTALTQAEEYAADEDMAMVFEVLEDAREEVESNQTAVSQITLAYDSYKQKYLSDVEALAEQAKKTLEFEQAEEELRIAADIFSEDEEIRELYKEIADLNTAHTTIAEAAELAEDLAYEELFRIMNAALEKVEPDSEAEKLLTDDYAVYKEAYMTQLNEKIGDPKTVSQYEEAIAQLEAAVALWPEDEDLTDRLEELKGSVPVSVNTMNIVDMKEGHVSRGWQNIDSDNLDGCIRMKTSATDNFGTIYNDAFLIMCGRSYVHSGTYMTYDCAQYNNLSGMVALWEESKSHAQNAVFFISGYKDDGTEYVLMQQSFPSATRPQPINVDLSGYSLVRIGLKILDEKGNFAQVHPIPIGVILSDLTMAK